jgi:hypothetical protein
VAVVFSDDFNRANAANLGSNWDADSSGDNIDWDLDTNTAECQNPTANGQWVRTVVAAHAAIADCKVQATQVGSGGDGGVIARVQDVVNNHGYACYHSSSGISMYRTNSDGSEVQIGSTIDTTQVANGVIAFEVSGTGATVTLKSWYQGAAIHTGESDSAAGRITSTGRTGLTNWSSVGTNSRYDDFSVDDLTVGGGGDPEGLLIGSKLVGCGLLGGVLIN